MRRALVIGVAAFDDASIVNLPYAANDAREFFRLITDPAIGAADRAGSRLIESPGRRDLLAALGDFYRSLSDADEFILFFAGHASRGPSGLIFDCRDTVPSRRTLTALGERDLFSILKERRGLRGTIILDTCHAGSLAELKADTRARGSLTDKPEIIEPDREGLALIMASGPHQRSYERDGNGLFSKMLFEAMRTGAGLASDRSVAGVHDIVGWIRGGLGKTRLEEEFWPRAHAQGAVADLFVCRNPRFDPNASTVPAPESRFGRMFSDMVERLLSDSNDDRARLQDQADRVRGGESLAGEDATVFRLMDARTEPFAGALILGVLPAIIFSVAVYFGADAIVTGAISGGLWLGLIVLALFRGDDPWREPQHHFLIVSMRGLCISRGADPALTTLSSWQEIGSLNFYDQVSTSGRTAWIGLQLPYDTPAPPPLPFLVRLPILRPLIVPIVPEYEGQPPRWQMAITSGTLTGFTDVDTLHGLIREYRDRRGALLPKPGKAAPAEPRPVMRGGSIEHAALAAVLTYDRLTTLKAPRLDLEIVSREMEARRIRRSPLLGGGCTIGEFETRLPQLLEEQRGKIVLLYFSGHGIARDGDLYLAFADTDPDRLLETGFALSKLPAVVEEARVARLVLVLDCCFAGSAGRAVGQSLLDSATLEQALSKRHDSLLILAGASAVQEALALSDQPSLFTGALIEVLREQREAGGAASLKAVSAATERRLRDLGLGQQQWTFMAPGMASGDGDVFLPGPASRAPAPTPELSDGAFEKHVHASTRTQAEFLTAYAGQALRPPMKARGMSHYYKESTKSLWQNVQVGLVFFVVLGVSGCIAVNAVPTSWASWWNPLIQAIVVIGTGIAAWKGSGSDDAHHFIVGPDGFVLVSMAASARRGGEPSDAELEHLGQLVQSLHNRTASRSEKGDGSTFRVRAAVPANMISTFKINVSRTSTNGDVTSEKSVLVWIDNSGASHQITDGNDPWPNLEGMCLNGNRYIAQSKSRVLERFAGRLGA